MEVVKELFDTEDLYDILNITKQKVSDEKALRSAYMKAALKYHPDKAPAEDREIFTKKFQIIQKINDLFKDPDLRKIYEETGSWPEDERIEFDVASFGRLDENAILDFKKIYQGSDEERQDVKKYYEEGNGDIFYVCDNVFFVNILDDEDRMNSVIEDLIEKGETKRQTKGAKSAKTRGKKLQKAKKEAEEAEELMKEKKLGSLGDLQNAIAKNRSTRGSFLDNLAAKYGGAETETKRNSKRRAESPDDGHGPSRKKSKGASAKGGRKLRSKSLK